MRFGSAYLLTNRVTGDTYVGITTQTVLARWKEHMYKANGARCASWLHRAIRKYGPESFAVVEIASAIARDNLLALEIDLIRDRAPTYNQSHGGEGTTGRKFSPEVLEARREKLRNRVVTPETKARISASCRAAMTAERREFLRHQLTEARARVDNEKRVNAVREAASTRKWSQESRDKLSRSCKGRRYTQDVIDRMRKSKMKPVLCTTTGVCYTNAKEAAKALGVSHRSVMRVLKGDYPVVKGYIFAYGGD